MSEIGPFIKMLREKANLSQRKLAQAAQISNTELSNIENGERKKIDRSFLEIIAPHLHVSCEELMEKAGLSNHSTTNHQQLPFFSLSKNAPNRIDLNKRKEVVVESLVKQISIEYNIADITYGPKNFMRDNLDVVAFTGGQTVIGIKSILIPNSKPLLTRTNPFILNLEQRIKSDFLNFYFFYKRQGYSDDKIKYICGILINDHQLDESMIKDKLDQFFELISPIFTYQIFFPESF